MMDNKEEEAEVEDVMVSEGEHAVEAGRRQA